MASERLLILQPHNWALRRDHGMMLYYSRYVLSYLSHFRRASRNRLLFLTYKTYASGNMKRQFRSLAFAWPLPQKKKQKCWNHLLRSYTCCESNRLGSLRERKAI